MIYRRTPQSPTKMLLRVVAGAGAGALVSVVAACGSTHANGLLPLDEDAAADDAAGGDQLGDDGGLIINPPDAGEDAHVDADTGDSGDSGTVDAHEEAGGPCGVVCGVVVHQEE
jgi:hypothetical protein